jgi:hypothetical protein
MRTPKFFVAAVALTGLAALAALAPAPAFAQAAPEASTQNVKLLGRPHVVVTPPGWTSQPADDSVAFTPPAGRTKDTFNCFVLAVEGQFGGQTPKDFAKAIAQSQQKESMPWGTITEPDEMTFVGLPAALISIGGTNPDNKNAEAMVILVAPSKDIAYAFVVRGRTDDIQDNAGDLAMIINGVAPGSSGGGGGGGGKNGPGKNGPGAGGDGTGCVGFGCNTGPAPSVDDPPWGLGVQGLSNRWRLENKKGKYIFMAAKPDAQVTVSHVWKDDPTYKATIKKARGAKAKLGKLDALLVEDGSKKTWHVTLGAQVTVIELSSSNLKAAEADAWPEFLGALTLVKKDTPPINNEKKGVRMTLANGLSLELGKGWFFNDAIASGATFGIKERGSYVMVQVRTAKVDDDSTQPFDDEFAAAQIKCKNAGGRQEESKLNVGGARDARQVRCVMDKTADKKLGKDIPKVVVIVRARGMHMFLFAKADGLDIPDARVADFLASLNLPR